MTLDLSGVNPANLVPFTESDQSIHEDALRRHVEDLAGVDGVNGIVCNGHAGEVLALSAEERERIVEIIDDVVDDDTPVISGVVGGSTTGVVEDARRAKAAGADALLVMPPHTPINGREDMAVAFFEDLYAGAELPLVLFQHPTWAGGVYDSDLLATLLDLDGVVAMKNAVWDIEHFQQDVQTLRRAGSDVQFLHANDEHLLASFAIKEGDGVILGLAAGIPEQIVELYDAVERGDLKEAREVYTRIVPLIDTVYGNDPVADAHTRLKVVLDIQGKLPNDLPRRPALPVSDEEVEEIRAAMEASGLPTEP